MLRRCYDDEQIKRDKGKSYSNCTVCDRWFYLSNFYEDIQKLPGYQEWVENGGDKRMEFNSESEACEALGVHKCSISSCYRRGSKCKGYKIERGH